MSCTKLSLGSASFARRCVARESRPLRDDSLMQRMRYTIHVGTPVTSGATGRIVAFQLADIP